MMLHNHLKSILFKKILAVILWSTLTLDLAQAQTGIYINNDEPYTKSIKVKLDVKIMMADSVLLSHDPAFPSATWQKAEKEIDWELLPGDGKKELFVLYKDRDGNISKMITESIILDTTPPKNGEVEINHGNNYINFLENVVVESRIQGADWIMVSNQANFGSARWEAYHPKTKYSFKEGEGEKKLYIKFKDHAGNESEVYEDRVIIDTKPPTEPKIELVHGSIVLDSATGTKYLNRHNTLLDLRFSVKEGKYMKIANAGAFFGLKWRLFQEKHYDWELGNYKDGKYRVGVIFRDIAKNETSSVYDEVIVDTSPPFGERILINEGDFYTKTGEVSLRIAATDAHKMMLSENKNFKDAKWEAYQTRKDWKFSDVDGKKEIYVKFKDIAGNESNYATDDIEKDVTPPTNGKIVLNRGEQKTLFANAHAQVSADGATFMQVSNRPDFAGEIWKSYHNNDIYVPLDKTPGIKKVYARFKDDAGNVSDPVSTEILLEVKPVGLKIAIDENAVFCNRTNREVNLKIFAKEAKEMMLSNNPDFNGANWEPYREGKTWQLSEKDGLKKVYVKFRSRTETISETVSDDIILDTTAPIGKSMELNRGLPNTFEKKVVVTVEAQDAIYMQLSEDSLFMNVQWTGYTNRDFYYQFKDFAGIHTLYTRFKDEAGNISNTISAKVKIQINPVSIGIIIDNDAKYCTDPDRKVKLFVGARSATEMMLSNKENFAGANWEPYQKQKEWILEEGEGVKKVYVKLKSKTGIESDPKYDEIILDILPPQNTNIKINGGSERTTKPEVEIALFAKDAISQQISKYPDFKRAKWLPYNNEPLKYFIGNEGGTYTIYARFKDVSGNISKAVADSIIKEIQPHNGAIAINKDQSFTIDKNGEVKLDIYSVRATEMMLSESPDFTGAEWQTIKKSIKWRLEGEDGQKRVYIKFRSKTLNESTPIHDEILLDRAPPQNCAVMVNTSAWLQYFNPNFIKIQLKAKDAYKFQISEYENFTGRPWQAYTDQPFTFRLSHPDKEVKLYTRFKDFYGNISDTIITPVEIDTSPPENNTYIINEGAQYTKLKQVAINSYSEDAIEMRLANSIQTLKSAEWKPYQDKLTWQLDKGNDNIKIIYVQYKDKFGNISKTVSQKIELDTDAPQKAKVEIDGNRFCNHPGGEISLKLRAEGARKMMLSNSADFTNSTWESFKAEKRWLLTEGDGEKTVFAKFGDEAGNESEVLEIRPVLDRVPPKALSINLNEGATLTNNKKVTLQLDASEAHEMIISNNGLFGLPAKWEPYRTQKTWYLEGQDGTKTVSVKFRDKAGNESAVIMQKIELDTEAPIVYNFEINNGETMVDGVDVELELKVKHLGGLPDARYMQVSNSKNFSDAAWEAFQEKVNWRMAGNGLQKVYVRLKDGAGNISLPFSDNLTVY